MVTEYLIEDVEGLADGRVIRRERPAKVHSCWACGRFIHWNEAEFEQLVAGSHSLASTVVLCGDCRDWKPTLVDMTQARLWRDLLRRFGRQRVATDG